MTVSDWLRSRTPPAPQVLLARVEAALAVGPEEPAAMPEQLLNAAVSLLEPLVAREDTGRDCAIDLLAADALVTYAFEAASVDVTRLDTRSRDAMVRLAALAPHSDDRTSARG